MSSSLSPAAEEHYRQLDQNFKRSPSNNSTNQQLIGQLLLKLKVALAECSLLMPSLDHMKSIKPDSLTKARHILEIGALHSIRIHDIPGFERYIAQLGPYYNDYRLVLGPSEFKYPLIGLNLLRLLTQHQIAQFHTILEGLVKEDGQEQIDILHSNPFISHPINLERWLMEGSYSKVWLARDHVPMEEYRYFVDLLVNTIRNEIAACEEKAYSSLPINDAGTLLFFKTPGEVIEFAKLRGWTIDPIKKTIEFEENDYRNLKADGINSMEKIIECTLGYAKELETIV